MRAARWPHHHLQRHTSPLPSTAARPPPCAPRTESAANSSARRAWMAAATSSRSAPILASRCFSARSCSQAARCAALKAPASLWNSSSSSCQAERGRGEQAAAGREGAV